MLTVQEQKRLFRGSAVAINGPSNGIFSKILYVIISRASHSLLSPLFYLLRMKKEEGEEGGLSSKSEFNSFSASFTYSRDGS